MILTNEYVSNLSDEDLGLLREVIFEFKIVRLCDGSYLENDIPLSLSSYVWDKKDLELISNELIKRGFTNYYVCYESLGYGIQWICKFGRFIDSFSAYSHYQSMAGFRGSKTKYHIIKAYNDKDLYEKLNNPFIDRGDLYEEKKLLFT